MLKKAGIVVAAAAAGLLAVSPLAFADDNETEQRGAVNVDDTTVQVPIQACGNDVLSGQLGIVTKGQEAESNDKAKCDQDNSVEN